MIIYRNFKGEEFKTKKEYDDNFKKLMNTSIFKFNSGDLNEYINEYFPERFKSIQTCVPYKSVKDGKIYQKEADDVIKVEVMNVYSKYIVLTITVSNRCDDKFKDYDNLYSGISLSTNYALRENILLKDFEKEVMKILKKVCNNWLEYEMKDMNKMLNDFIKEN